MSGKPIGIFGGTFDPVHLGHLRPASELAQVCDLAEIRFLPCRIPVLKDMPHASDELRLEMLTAAIAGIPGFSVDSRELGRSGPSYSYDTLFELRRENPDAPLCFMIGLDAWQGFTQWHRWQDILSLAHVVVAQRPGLFGDPDPALEKLVDRHGTTNPLDMHSSPAGNIYFHGVTQLDISSSLIREKLSQGQDVTGLVPPVVAGIIKRSGCYQTREAT